VGREDLQHSSGGTSSQPFSSLWPRGDEVARDMVGSTSQSVFAIHPAFLRYPDLLRLIDDKLGHHSLLLFCFQDTPRTLLDRNFYFVCLGITVGLIYLVCASSTDTHLSKSCPLREEIPRQRIVCGWKQEKESELRV